MKNVEKIRTLLDKIHLLLDEIDTAKVRFNWHCPMCKKVNKWVWDRDDYKDGWPMKLECEFCGMVTLQDKPKEII